MPSGTVTPAGPSSLPPSGAAGGDLSGTYPNPAVAKVAGTAVSTAGGVTEIDGGFLVAPVSLTGTTRALSSVSTTGYLARFVDSTGLYGAFVSKGGTLFHGNAGDTGAPLLRIQQWTGAADVDFLVVDPDNVTAATVGQVRIGGASGSLISKTGLSTTAITSGALPTATLSSGAGAQLLTTRDVDSVTPFTGDATNNAATCKIELSPDNVTYSILNTVSIAAALNLTGALDQNINVHVPAGWYLKLTATHGTIGTTSYY